MRSKLADLFTDIATHAASFAEPVLEQLCRMAALEAETTKVRWNPKTQPNNVAIWDWDLSNNLNRLDPNGAFMFGVLPSKSARGLPNSVYLEALHPDDLEGVIRSLNTTLKRGGVWEAEYRIIATGQVRWASGRGFCFFDKANRPERFTGAITAQDE